VERGRRRASNDGHWPGQGRPRASLVIQDVPFNSNDKMVERLNNAGIPATSYKSEDLKNFRQDNPIIDAIMDYKRLTKLLSTYASRVRPRS
jgi:hypothetical protein